MNELAPLMHKVLRV